MSPDTPRTVLILAYVALGVGASIVIVGLTILSSLFG